MGMAGLELGLGLGLGLLRLVGLGLGLELGMGSVLELALLLVQPGARWILSAARCALSVSGLGTCPLVSVGRRLTLSQPSFS